MGQGDSLILNIQKKMEFKPGDKVHYISEYAITPDQYENGIVKEGDTYDQNAVRVVYHCNGDWENYKDYTGALTYIRELRPGWIEKQELEI